MSSGARSRRRPDMSWVIRMRRASSIVWCAALALSSIAGGWISLAASVQQSPPSACIVGQVTDGRTRQGIDGAVVVASVRGRAVDRVVTGPDGQFLVRASVGSTVALVPTAAGYGVQDQPSALSPPSGLTAEARDSTCVQATPMVLWPNASLRGSLVAGNVPLVAVPVKLLSVQWASGKPSVSLTAISTTDDRGDFQFFDVVPGHYVVAYLPTYSSTPFEVAKGLAVGGMDVEWFGEFSALGDMSTTTSGVRVDDHLLSPGRGNAVVLEDGEPAVSQPATFPDGALDAIGADWLSVKSGDRITGIVLRSNRTKAGRVSGRLVGDTGPVAHTPVFLHAAADLPRTSDFAAAIGFSDSQGRFALLGVSPGRYRLEALRPSRTGPARHASLDVEVSEARSPIVDVTLVQTEVIAGRLTASEKLVTDLASAQKTITVRVGPVDRVMVRPADMRCPVLADMTFRCSNLPAGRYALDVIAENWFPVELRTAAKFSAWVVDVTQGGINVDAVMSNQSTGVYGAVSTSTLQDSQVRTYVAVFPDCTRCEAESDSGRRFKVQQVGTAGTFRFSGLPPGDYFVASMTSPPPPDWSRSQNIARLSADAVRVTVRPETMAPVTPRPPR